MLFNNFDNINREHIKRRNSIYESSILICFTLLLCVSSIDNAFIVKNIDTKILFVCLMGLLDSSTVEKN
jgi:hypothetical protein